MQNRSMGLTPRQRSAFIMFDGKRSTEDVLKATAGLQVSQDDLNHLITLGLLELSALAAAPAQDFLPAPAQDADGVPSQSAQDHYSKAYPVATRLTAGLGLRGFRLNLAVEAAGNLTELQALAPKIEQAVGAEKFKELHRALYY